MDVEVLGGTMSYIPTDMITPGTIPRTAKVPGIDNDPSAMAWTIKQMVNLVFLFSLIHARNFRKIGPRPAELVELVILVRRKLVVDVGTVNLLLGHVDRIQVLFREVFLVEIESSVRHDGERKGDA